MIKKTKQFIVDKWTRFKKWIVFIVIGGTALASVPFVVPDNVDLSDTATSTPETINLNVYEIEIEKVIGKIEASQEKYIKKNGRYWQGLKTNIADENKPEYQSEDWNDLGFTFDYPFSVEVHQYEKPTGEYGYLIFFEIEEDGRIYKRIYDKELKQWY